MIAFSPQGGSEFQGPGRLKRLNSWSKVYHYHCCSHQQSEIISLPARLASRRGTGEKPNTATAPEKWGDWSTCSLGGTELRMLSRFPCKAGADASGGSEAEVTGKEFEGCILLESEVFEDRKSCCLLAEFFWFFCFLNHPETVAPIFFTSLKKCGRPLSS